MKEILNLCERYNEELIQNRRWLHAHPELGNQELETGKYIKEQLSNMGIEYKDGIANTGIVATIYGEDTNGKTLLIRADIDALPMQEKNDVTYKSQFPGFCHSCGHDVHTAILLGTARVLSSLKHRIKGSVKLCFQPAEEASVGGAQLMVEQGVLNGVDAAVALHVDPSKSVGVACIEEGPVTSFPDFFSITFNGVGGHGSFPSKTIDPILPAISAYNMISLIHKKISPLEPNVVQVCMINAGTAQAIIPDTVTMQGTVRTLSRENREIIKSQLELIAKNTSEIFNTQYEFSYRGRCMPVVNNSEMVTAVKNSVKDIFTKGFMANEGMKIGGEDFCFISDKVPAVMMMVGSNDDTDSTKYPLHNPLFNVNEKVLPTAVQAFSKIAIDYLK